MTSKIKFCKNCECGVKPKRGLGFGFFALVIATFLVMGANIYVTVTLLVLWASYAVYYVLKGKECPICGDKNWG